jgi:hypothetical protein
MRAAETLGKFLKKIQSGRKMAALLPLVGSGVFCTSSNYLFI